MIPRTMALIMLLGTASLTGQCKEAADIPGLLMSGAGSQRPRVTLSRPSSQSPYLRASESIFVEFDREMDWERTRSAFSVSGSGTIEGKPRFIGRRLVYELQSPPDAGHGYVLRVGAGAADVTGNSLELDYIVHFVSGSRSDTPLVVGTTPTENAQGVATTATLGLTFSRAMDRLSVEQAFSLSPATAGSFAWNAGSDRLTFTPYAPLTNGVTYRLNLSTEAEDAEGIALGDPVGVSFLVGPDLNPPTFLGFFESGVIAALVSGQTGVFKDATFQLRFSEPMDYASVESGLSVIDRSNGQIVGGDFTWNAGFQRVTFRPAEPLEPRGQYRLELAASAADSAGNRLGQAHSLEFRVDNSGGASSSEYLTALAATKVGPDGAQNFSIGSNNPDVIQLTASVTPLGSLMEVQIVFSQELLPSSIPENVVFGYVLGSHGARGNLLSMSLGPLNRVLTLQFSSVGTNQFQLELVGGRNGILTVPTGSESSTWLNGSLILNFAVTP